MRFRRSCSTSASLWTYGRASSNRFFAPALSPEPSRTGPSARIATGFLGAFGRGGRTGGRFDAPGGRLLRPRSGLLRGRRRSTPARGAEVGGRRRGGQQRQRHGGPCNE